MYGGCRFFAVLENKGFYGIDCRRKNCEEIVKLIKVFFNEIVEDDEILLNLSAYPHIKFLQKVNIPSNETIVYFY